MKKQKWEVWVKNRNTLEKDFKHYLKMETIREGATKIEVEDISIKQREICAFPDVLLMI